MPPYCHNCCLSTTPKPKIRTPTNISSPCAAAPLPPVAKIVREKCQNATMQRWRASDGLFAYFRPSGRLQLRINVLTGNVRETLKLGASNAFVIVEPPYLGKSIEKHRTATQPALCAGNAHDDCSHQQVQRAGPRSGCSAQLSPEQQPGVVGVVWIAKY
jgi:hypothetical protein